uniref:Organic solute carrier partner 1a n=1 Tax=Nothobranchius furzeri TaxID=105023 RepID=A0A1A8A3B2_NOTFU
MGGEMLYVLDQRLRALNTSEEQSERGVWSEQDRRRVISDIIGTLFSKSFMDELLKPQPLYSHRTMKSSDNSPNPLAKEELNLLAHLMGSMMLEHVPKGDPGFCISFFSPEPEEEEGAPGGTQEFRVINIQAVQDEETTSTLAQIAGQFTDKEAIPGDESSSTGADLLAMMDDL